MTTATKPKKTVTVNTKKRDPKYRVIPNLSIRGKDLIKRINNRSILPEPDGVYSLDDKIDETRRMSKLDVSREMLKNQKEINSLTSKLTNHGGSNKPSTGSNQKG